MRIFLVVGGAALLLCGCTKPAPAPSPPSQSEAEKIAASAESSFTGGNVEAIMAHYADGAVIFDPSSLDPTTDRAMQTKWAAGYVTMKPADMTIASRNVQVLDADTIVASGVMAFTAEVGPTRQMLRTRYTDVYQKQADGSWKIVHEHMSGPPPETPLP
jgi:ketosteroid isomerase-like protein